MHKGLEYKKCKVLLQDALKDHKFLTCAAIERFDLTHFSFLPTATYGHFTDCSYPWEKIIDL